MIKYNKVTNLEILLQSYRICCCIGFILGDRDYGGPKKEFLTDVLHEIEDNYFLNGVKHNLKNHYYNVGTILGEVTSEELTLVTII